MPRSDVARAPTLLQELLNHPQGDAESVGNLGPCAFVAVITIQNPLAKVQRKRTHTPLYHTPLDMAILFIEML